MSPARPSTVLARRLLPLLALAVLALPSSAAAADKGLETDMTWGSSASEQDRTAADVTDLGAHWVRLTMAWHDVETSPDSYSNSALRMYDDAIAKTRATGAKVIVTVYTAPGWSSGTTSREGVPRDPADYADFMRFVANRYRGKVAAWEIWNEENYDRFWPTGPDGGAYARLLKAAQPAVKVADPSATVVFGGLALNDYAFVENAYRAVPDLGRYYDVMATHPYTFPVAPPEAVAKDSAGRIAKGSFPGYREVRKTMLAHGDSKPIWLTEFGWSTNTVQAGVTAAQQADYLTRAYKYLDRDPYVRVACWYELRNNRWAGDANTWEDQLGLVNTDFGAKPAYNAFKAYVPGSGAPTTAGSSDRAAPRRRIRLRVRRVAMARGASRRLRRARRRMRLVVGTVSGTGGGRVKLRLQRRRGGHWVRSSARVLRVNGAGRFSRVLRRLGRGRWRVRAQLVAPGRRRTSSRMVYFTA